MWNKYRKWNYAPGYEHLFITRHTVHLAQDFREHLYAGYDHHCFCDSYPLYEWLIVVSLSNLKYNVKFLKNISYPPQVHWGFHLFLFCFLAIFRHMSISKNCYFYFYLKNTKNNKIFRVCCNWCGEKSKKISKIFREMSNFFCTYLHLFFKKKINLCTFWCVIQSRFQKQIKQNVFTIGKTRQICFLFRTKNWLRILKRSFHFMYLF